MSEDLFQWLSRHAEIAEHDGCTHEAVMLRLVSSELERLQAVESKGLQDRADRCVEALQGISDAALAAQTLSSKLDDIFWTIKPIEKREAKPT